MRDRFLVFNVSEASDKQRQTQPESSKEMAPPVVQYTIEYTNFRVWLGSIPNPKSEYEKFLQGLSIKFPRHLDSEVWRRGQCWRELRGMVNRMPFRMTGACACA